MKQLSLEAKGGQWLADLASWERESAPDNRNSWNACTETCAWPGSRR